MTSIFPDPNDSKHTDLLALLFWIFAMIVLALTLPGCQQQEKQKYQPFVPHSKPAELSIDKIRPPVHDAAERVDKILEKTPVPAIATPLADDVLDGIERIDPLPPTTAPDPKVAEIIEPEFETVADVESPDMTEPAAGDEPGSGLLTWSVVCIGLIALLYLAYQMLKGSEQDDEDTQRKETAS